MAADAGSGGPATPLASTGLASQRAHDPLHSLSPLALPHRAYYTEHVQQHWRGEFPHLDLVSFPRVVAMLPTILVPLTAYLHTNISPKSPRCTSIPTAYRRHDYP